MYSVLVMCKDFHECCIWLNLVHICGTWIYYILYCTRYVLKMYEHCTILTMGCLPLPFGTHKLVGSIFVRNMKSNVCNTKSRKVYLLFSCYYSLACFELSYNFTVYKHNFWI